MSVNFNDTKITFQSKSHWDLQLLKFIFSVLNRPFFVFFGYFNYKMGITI